MAGSESLKPISLYPRESLLRLVSGYVPTEIVLTSNGYWGVVGAGLMVFLSGHAAAGSKGLFDTFNVPGQEITRLPAERFLTVLHQAASLVPDADNVLIDPKVGVQVNDKFGTPSQFSLGPVDNWSAFRVYASTAKIIVDALEQGKEDDEVTLYNVPAETSGQTLRLGRGRSKSISRQHSIGILEAFYG